jgi:ParB family chromosome partitioning protein
MPRQHHYLKCETKFFEAVKRGEKNFELRKNDRNFKKYDMVYLNETVNGVETGRQIPSLEIQYLLTDKDGGRYGLCKGYCVFCW